MLSYKIQEKFKLIRYIYSVLFPKIYNRTNNFRILNKSNFEFHFATWRGRKHRQSVAAKIVSELPPEQAKQITVTELSKPKDPIDYQTRKVKENQHALIDFKIDAY